MPYGVAVSERVSGNTSSYTFDENVDAGETFLLKVYHVIRDVFGEATSFEDTLCKLLAQF